MSAINANIVVEPITLDVTQSSINQNVTLEPITLGIFSTAPVSDPGTPDGSLQYRVDQNTFGGLANAIVSSGNLTFTNLANLKIDGGVNAYYLQTDGAGTLSWAAGGTPTGSGVPSGANTQIQLSDGSGAFDSGAGFTFDKSSNIFSTPGQAIIAGNVDSTGGIFNGDGGGLSNVAAANVVGLSLSEIANGTSNVNIPVINSDVVVSVGGTSNVASFFTGGANVNGDLNVVSDITSTAGMFTGDGGGLSNIIGSNVSGAVSSATSATTATTAGTVTTAAQPNITSVGTLTSLEVSGTTSIQEAIEKVTIDAGGATGTIDYNILDGAIVYYTGNATGNFVLNLRGNVTTTLNTVMDIGESMTFSFMNTNGGFVYYITGLQIDGTTRTIEWIDGTAPTTGSANAIDNYSFNVIKTASDTYTVLGAVGAYY
jgi:hypothetical protein